MDSIRVDLGPSSYPVFVGEGILDKLGEMMELYDLGKDAVVITDSNVARILDASAGQLLTRSLTITDTIVIPAGERSKTLANVEMILTRLLQHNYDRNLLILAVGGGVVGDIAGFAASVYKRGVRYLQVPTTLLAQVDASIGGKTGVNHSAGKNQIGTFHQPKLVWVDLMFLRSLPEEEIINGMGEVLKYGVIGDAELFALCETNLPEILALDSEYMPQLVRRSCAIKADIVAKDERESDVRLILNFGHTIGHALEATSRYKISHGLGVILGMVAESMLARDLGLLPPDDFARIENLAVRLKPTARIRGLSVSEVVRFLAADKKAVAGRPRFVLPRSIGKVEIVDSVATDAIANSINSVIKLLA